MANVDTFGALKTSQNKPRALNQGGIWGKVLFYFFIAFFVVNLLALVGTVVVESFAQRWFGTWLPPAYTTRWYEFINTDHDMGQLLFNTLFVAIATTVIALLIGFPAAYVLARKKFRFKPLLTGLYLLPMMIPPMAYGIPLATLLIRWGLGGTLIGVIIINLVPVVPFVILILAPFIEQVDLSLESASRMLGANRFQTFMRVVLPLVIPGLLSAGMLALVRTIAMFELTFLVADSRSQTLVVALYADAFAAGIRPSQAISAMAVVYMLTTMTLLIIALIFVKPTQFVVSLKSR
jgi:putative spermidine/putrescine transport system permease protein